MGSSSGRIHMGGIATGRGCRSRVVGISCGHFCIHLWSVPHEGFLRVHGSIMVLWLLGRQNRIQFESIIPLGPWGCREFSHPSFEVSILLRQGLTPRDHLLNFDLISLYPLLVVCDKFLEILELKLDNLGSFCGYGSGVFKEVSHRGRSLLVEL